MEAFQDIEIRNYRRAEKYSQHAGRFALERIFLQDIQKDRADEGS
jgi:hypothetical protein